MVLSFGVTAFFGQTPLRCYFVKGYITTKRLFAKIAFMGLPKLKTKISIEKYLEAEKVSPIRYEYVDGEIFAMAGASDNHERISMNLSRILSNHLLDSICEPFANNIKVRVRNNVYYYPDILISREQNPENPYFRNNPILIIEIVSKSTERIDRREKVFCISKS
ncbi:MAG: Uma2 family endonuclease [Blastocatellia bacterium]|nr:Uma2 family endonuclease [Blastocatellia bacterium]